MALWGTLITGAVGVAGIGGTILAARIAGKTETANIIRSISAEDDRARQAEKRRVYARFLAASNEAMQARFKWISFEEADIDTKLAAVSEYGARTAEAITAAAEIRLIGPAEVGDLAERAINVMPDYDPGAPNQADDYNRVTSRLIRAMRADLGEPPLPGKADAADREKDTYS